VISSRTSSTLVRLAASISCTSVEVPAVISRQGEHSPQGVTVGPRSQFRQRARMRASVVLPTPRGPVSKMACGTRCCRIALRSGVVTCACPVTSSKP
jgi:hypothetical protein